MTEVDFSLDEKITSIDRTIDELMKQRQSLSRRLFTPLYPLVFLRVLPLEEERGGIILPENSAQNKTIHEGVVVCTWAACAKSGGKRSDLTPGDHVLFPHWCGMEIPGFDRAHYRIVKEEGWSLSKDGGIFATVEDLPCEDTPMTVLKRILIDECPDLVAMHNTLNWIMGRVEESLYLIDRKHSGVTLSGA